MEENVNKMTVSDWDMADDIETKEDVIAFLEAALVENDAMFLLKVIGNIARSKGMSQLAKELNLNSEGLYDSLSPKENPSFTAVVKVLDNLGFRLKVEQKISA
jgi:probable addiction module antidote protein